MGVRFRTMTIDAALYPTQVKEKFRLEQQRDKALHGDRETGGFGVARGLDFKPNVFPSAADARAWLWISCPNKGSAIAVRYTDDTGARHWMIGAWCHC